MSKDLRQARSSRTFCVIGTPTTWILLASQDLHLSEPWGRPACQMVLDVPSRAIAFYTSLFAFE